MLGVLAVQEHPVLVFAGDHVDQAAPLVGRDIDHPFALFCACRLAFIVQGQGHAEVDCFVRRRIIGHDVSAAVGGNLAGLLLLGGGVSLFGANVDLARGPDRIARVDLGLGGVAGRFQRQSNQLVRVQNDVHFLCRRDKFDQVGVAAVGGTADVNPAILTLAQREVAGFLSRRLGRDVVRLRPDILQ